MAEQTRFNTISEQEKANLMQQTVTILMNLESAHQHFEYLQIQPIYPYLLTEIISNNANDENLRLISLICFKNYIPSYWKRDQKISDSEKLQLKQSIIKLLNETSDTIALHLSILIATIARVEFPTDWKTPVENMIEIIECAESSYLLKYRCLLALNMIVKTISKKVILNSRSQFQISSEFALPYLSNLFTNFLAPINSLIYSFLTAMNEKYATPESININNVPIYAILNTNNWNNLYFNNNPLYYQNIIKNEEATLHTLNQQLGALKINAEIALICVKSLFPMIYYVISFTPPRNASNIGNESPRSRSQRVASVAITFLCEIMKTLNVFLLFRRFYGFMNDNFCLRKIFDEMIIKAHRGFYKTQKSNLPIFSNIVTPLFHFTFSHFQFNVPFINTSFSFYDKLYRPLILLYKNIISLKPESDKHPNAIAIKSIKDEFALLFNHERMIEFLGYLICNFLRLSNKNLVQWNDSPEEFYEDFDNDDQLYNLRSAAESLFMIFNNNYSEITSNVVVQYFLSTMQQKRGDSMDDILEREVAYTALGLSFYSIYDIIQFDEWFDNFFLRDLNSSASSTTSYRIISRRIAWLFGRLVEKISQEKRTMIYQILLSLMSKANENNDIVIRLTAADSLSQLIDDMDFDINLFAPFLSQALSSYFGVLSDCDEENSKLKILQFLSILFIQCKDLMAEHAENVIKGLGLIWSKEDKSGILKGAIMRSLCSLLENIYTKGSQYHQVLLPLIQIGCNVENPDSLFLMDDSLLLSLQLLKCGKSSEAFYFELFPNLLKITRNSTEHSSDILLILRAFIYLSPPHSLFIDKFGAEIDEIGVLLLGNINFEGSELLCDVMGTFLNFYPTYAHVLRNFFLKLITLMVSNTEEEEYKHYYVPLLSRMAFYNSQLFLFLLTSICPNSDYSQFFNLFFSLVEGVKSEKKKVVSFALSSLLPILFHQISSHIAEIIDLAISCSYDDNEQSEFSDSEEDDCEVDLSFYDLQVRNEYNQSILNKITAKQFCKNILSSLPSIVGEDAVNRAIASVHPSLLSQL